MHAVGMVRELPREGDPRDGIHTRISTCVYMLGRALKNAPKGPESALFNRYQHSIDTGGEGVIVDISFGSLEADIV